ncbi:uncharacterized protein LOC134053626 [Cinclus cinclus]|uniref:uncharacterized protein LOC134053626 n=1 Tax=Cinclus cinclus TaxID=127875 RepID=UPI002E0D9E72
MHGVLQEKLDAGLNMDFSAAAKASKQPYRRQSSEQNKWSKPGMMWHCDHAVLLAKGQEEETLGGGGNLVFLSLLWMLVGEGEENRTQPGAPSLSLGKVMLFPRDEHPFPKEMQFLAVGRMTSREESSRAPHPHPTGSLQVLSGPTPAGAGLKQGLGRLGAVGKFGNGVGRAVWMGFVPTWVRRRHRLCKLDAAAAAAAAAAPGNLSKEKGRRGAVAQREECEFHSGGNPKEFVGMDLTENE